METQNILGSKPLPMIGELPDPNNNPHRKLVEFLHESIWGDINTTWSDDVPVGEYRHEVKAGQYTFDCELVVATTTQEYICNWDETLRSDPVNVRFYRILILDRSNHGRVVAIGADIDPKSAIRSLLVDPSVRRMVRAWKKRKGV